MNESQDTGAARENDNKEIKSIENLLEACRDLQNEHGYDVQFYAAKAVTQRYSEE